MSLRATIERLRHLTGRDFPLRPVTVFADDHAEARQRLAEAREAHPGRRVRAIVFDIVDVADTFEEAESMVAEHRASSPDVGLRVCRRRAGILDPAAGVLAEYVPPEEEEDPEDEDNLDFEEDDDELF